MKHLNNRILLNPIKQENNWDYDDPVEMKLGKVAFDFKSEDNKFKAGDEVYYEHEREIKLNGVDYLLVRENDLICQKQ